MAARLAPRGPPGTPLWGPPKKLFRGRHQQWTSSPAPAASTSRSASTRSWTSTSTRPSPSTSASCASPAIRTTSRRSWRSSRRARASAGLWNMFLPDPDARRRALQQRLRPARRDPRAQPHRLGGLQLLGARHRQHGGAAPVRHRRAARALAGAAAGGGDPLRVRDDRARRGLLGRDQHRAADRARRRRVRAQRAQVVDLRRAAPPLPGDDRDGQDAGRRPAAQASRA